MWIVGFSHRVQENLVNILLASLFHAFQEASVSPSHHLTPLLGHRSLIELFLQKLALNFVLPEQVGLIEVCRPSLLSAVQINEAVALEIVGLPYEWADFRDPLFDPCLENIVDCFGRAKIPKQDGFTDVAPVSSAESVHIALCLKNFIGIQILEIGLQESL